MIRRSLFQYMVLALPLMEFIMASLPQEEPAMFQWVTVIYGGLGVSLAMESFPDKFQQLFIPNLISLATLVQEVININYIILIIAIFMYLLNINHACFTCKQLASCLFHLLGAFTKQFFKLKSMDTVPDFKFSFDHGRDDPPTSAIFWRRCTQKR